MTITMDDFAISQLSTDSSFSDSVLDSRKDAAANNGIGKVQLERTIGLFGGCTMLVGVIVGSGIFVSAGGVLKDSGTPFTAIMVWVACGVYCILGALCYAELGTMVPKSGGDYTYISQAFGPFAGYIFLWISLFSINPSCIAVTALAFAKYVLKPLLSELEPEADERLLDNCWKIVAAEKLLATCALLVVALVNCYRISWATGTQNVTTIAKVCALAAVILCGIYYLFFVDATGLGWDVLNTGSVRYNFLNVAKAFCFGIFTFNGWGYLNIVAEEVKQPEKNLSRAILISLSLVTILYVSINLAYFAVLDLNVIRVSQAVAVDFAEKALPPAVAHISKYVIPIFVAVSCVGGMNGTIFTYARMFFAGAREGQLPEMISMISISFVTPVVSVMLLTTTSTFLIFIAGVDTLMQYMAFSQILIYINVVASLLKLRITEPQTPRPVKVPLFVPVIFIAVSVCVLVVIVITDLTSLVKTGGPILVGLVPYFCFVHYQLLPKPVYRLWISITHTVQKLLFIVAEDNMTKSE